MNFEICPNCTPDQWEPISLEKLRGDLQAAGYDPKTYMGVMAVDPKVIIPTATAMYRKHVPSTVKDWALHDYGVAR